MSAEERVFADSKSVPIWYWPAAGNDVRDIANWALEGLSQSLAQEVADFGIKVTLIEPAGFSTDWAGDSAKRSDPIEAYADVKRRIEDERASRNAEPGDPQASAEAIMRVVDADDPPLRVFFGSAPLGIATRDYEQRLETWNAWQDVADIAQG